MDVARCDLHVHSIHSTDSGNFALRRARLGESYTEPERVYAVARRRGMTFVTISDHNTVDGALRIADKPGAFLSVEVTTRFPEDHLPLHVLVWNLTERDHAELQSYRSSVYELVDFLVERGLHHGLAHPLYRMGPPITVQHVERMMLLFGIWEGRNGARPEDQNTLACRLAAAVTPAYLEKLAERHDLAPRHRGRICSAPAPTTTARSTSRRRGPRPTRRRSTTSSRGSAQMGRQSAAHMGRRSSSRTRS